MLRRHQTTHLDACILPVLVYERIQHPLEERHPLMSIHKSGKPLHSVGQRCLKRSLHKLQLAVQVHLRMLADIVGELLHLQHLLHKQACLGINFLPGA